MVQNSVVEKIQSLGISREDYAGQMSGEDVYLMLKTSISGVVRAVIAMSSSLGIKTTAEGVETPQQFNQLSSGLPVEPAEAGSRSQRPAGRH